MIPRRYLYVYLGVFAVSLLLIAVVWLSRTETVEPVTTTATSQTQTISDSERIQAAIRQSYSTNNTYKATIVSFGELVAYSNGWYTQKTTVQYTAYGDATYQKTIVVRSNKNNFTVVTKSDTVYNTDTLNQLGIPAEIINNIKEPEGDV